MGKSKRRILKNGINDKFPYMTRESALENVIKNIDNKAEALDIITLFDLTAEEILEAGAAYEDVVSLGALVRS